MQYWHEKNFVLRRHSSQRLLFLKIMNFLVNIYDSIARTITLKIHSELILSETVDMGWTGWDILDRSTVLERTLIVQFINALTHHIWGPSKMIFHPSKSEMTLRLRSVMRIVHICTHVEIDDCKMAGETIQRKYWWDIY